MLRGNSKKARENARKYVDGLIDYPVGEEDKHADIRAICADEMGAEWSYATFKEWCYGLPSSFDSAAFLVNGSSYDVLADVLEETPEERTAFEKRVSRKEADDRVIYMAFSVLDA